ncbi:MAG: DUF1080 domain-containing protein [Verrucomicrobiota bacterium]
MAFGLDFRGRAVWFAIGIVAVALAVGCQSKDDQDTSPNSEYAGRGEWVDMLKGRSLGDFRIFGGDSTQMFRWTLEEGVLALSARDQEAKVKSKADLVVTNEAFGDFEITLQWKVGVGGNGGVFYRVKEGGYTHPWHTGLEYQLLDNENHKEGEIPTHKAGELYDLFGYEGDVSNPAMTWNTSRIVAVGKRLEHWLNGKKVVDVAIGSNAWKTAYDKSKYKDYDEVAAYPDGHIVLQDHGDPLWIRDLRIRRIESE